MTLCSHINFLGVLHLGPCLTGFANNWKIKNSNCNVLTFAYLFWYILAVVRWRKTLTSTNLSLQHLLIVLFVNNIVDSFMAFCLVFFSKCSEISLNTFMGRDLCWSLFCEFCRISKNTFSYRTPSNN